LKSGSGRRWATLVVLCSIVDLGCAASPEESSAPDSSTPGVPAGPNLPADLLARLQALSPAELPGPRPDPTNAWADDERASALGQSLFFDPRFSGPLLDSDNDGAPGTLGLQGEVGKVSCQGCHDAQAGFLDNRSARGQISLASSWTRRRTPSLLDMGQATILTWDGRRDTAYNQIFGVIESPIEFNSSRLFVAQQINRYYKAQYEAIFGALPSLDAYERLEPSDAGCAELPVDPVAERCPKPGHDDPEVVQILVNIGKAIGAYERHLTCGPSRFDAWLHGDLEALSAEESAGAVVFVKAGCDTCHSGPALSDQQFHNVGAANLQPNFIEPFDDSGAAEGLAGALADPLNSRGIHSDGDDGRLDFVGDDLSALEGAFRTPGLRCVSRRPSFLHAGQKRSIEDVILLFDRGGDSLGFRGTKDELMVPLGLTAEERAQLAAFLRALDGPGPDAEWLATPALPGTEP
jgi:cytochrome c peroxidase